MILTLALMAAAACIAMWLGWDATEEEAERPQDKQRPYYW